MVITNINMRPVLCTCRFNSYDYYNTSVLSSPLPLCLPPAADDSDEDSDRLPRAKYKQRAKQFLADLARDGGEGGSGGGGGGGRIELSSADYHAERKVLVTGFTNGAFLIHEMPDVTLIHSLR